MFVQWKREIWNKKWSCLHNRLNGVVNMTLKFIFRRTFVFGILLTGAFSLQLTNNENIRKGTTYARLSSPIYRVKRENDVIDPLPENTDIEITVSGSKVNLSLHRNHNILPEVPIYVQRNGDICRMELPSKRTTALYQDLHSGASVELECVKRGNNSCKHLVRGSFSFQKNNYMLEPDDSDISDDRDVNDDVIHVIFETHVNYDFMADSIYPEGKPKFHVDLPLNQTGHHVPTNRKKRAVVPHKVEFLPVTDYPIYDFWYQRSEATTASAKDLDAVEKIREFYAFVLNAVDIRYQSIVSSTISIQIVFAGIFIATGPTVSTWTEDNMVTVSGGKDQVDSSVALDDFKDWLAAKTAELPTYDHAMAFTGYDLVRSGSNTVAGLAWVGGACDFTSPNANSISEDHFDAGMAVTAAHELGHNLGSTHDGDGNACSADEKNVMSPSKGGVTDSRAVNHLVFSSCSVDQFEAYISALDSSGNNCLLTLSAGHDPGALDAYKGLEAGLLYGPDAQCEVKVGTGSYFCRPMYTDMSELCAVLWCSVPGSTSCRAGIAWEGSVCGNQKLCRSGVCTADPAAPTVSDDCPHGDLPGIVHNSMNCSELISGNPGYCYQKYFSGRCCHTCNEYYIGITGCEYGDRSTNCDVDRCPNYDDNSHDVLCCGTCAVSSSTTTTTTTTTLTTPETTIATPTTTPVTTTPKTLTSTSSTMSTTTPTSTSPTALNTTPISTTPKPSTTPATVPAITPSTTPTPTKPPTTLQTTTLISPATTIAMTTASSSIATTTNANATKTVSGNSSQPSENGHGNDPGEDQGYYDIADWQRVVLMIGVPCGCVLVAAGIIVVIKNCRCNSARSNVVKPHGITPNSSSYPQNSVITISNTYTSKTGV